MKKKYHVMLNGDFIKGKESGNMRFSFQDAKSIADKFQEMGIKTKIVNRIRFSKACRS